MDGGVMHFLWKNRIKMYLLVKQWSLMSHHNFMATDWANEGIPSHWVDVGARHCPCHTYSVDMLQPSTVQHSISPIYEYYKCLLHRMYILHREHYRYASQMLCNFTYVMHNAKPQLHEWVTWMAYKVFGMASKTMQDAVFVYTYFYISQTPKSVCMYVNGHPDAWWSQESANSSLAGWWKRNRVHPEPMYNVQCELSTYVLTWMSWVLVQHLPPHSSFKWN